MKKPSPFSSGEGPSATRIGFVLSSLLLLPVTPVHALVPTISADQPSDQAVPADIIVTGTRESNRVASKSLAPIDVLGGSALKTTGAVDLRDALTQLIPSMTRQPLVSGAGNLTSALRLRGLSPDHVLVLINGKRRHNTANITTDLAGSGQQGASPVDLDLIPESAIERIEVLRDGAAAQYGSDAIAGVVNIILKSADTGGSISTTSGAYYRGDGYTGDVSGNIGLALGTGFLNLSADYTHQDHTSRGGVYTLTGKANAHSNGNPEFNREALAFNAGHPLGSAFQLYAFGTYSRRDAESIQFFRTGVLNTVPQLYPNGFEPVLTDHENDYAVTAGIKGKAGDWNVDLSSTYGTDSINIGLFNSVNADLFHATGTSPTDFRVEHFRFSQWTNDLDVTRQIGILNVAFGGEYRHELYRIGAGDAASSYGTGSTGLGGLAGFSAGSFGRDVLGGYIDLSARITSRWQIEGAGRYEHYSDAGSTTNGKLSTRYELSDHIALRGTVSTGFRAPSLSQEHFGNLAIGPTRAAGLLPANGTAARLLGSVPLKPEKSVNLSAGVVVTPVNGLTLSLDAYQVTVRDRIVLGGNYFGQAAIDALREAGYAITSSPLISVNYFSNGAKTRTRGLDLSAAYTRRISPDDQLRLDLSLNLNKTRILSIGIDGNGNPLLDSQKGDLLTTATPRSKLVFGGTWTHSRLSFTIHETRYGKTSDQLTYYGGPNANSPTIFYDFVEPVKYQTDVELGYDLSSRLHLALGARNLFNVYPKEIPVNNRSFGVNRFDLNSGSIGWNGGYYYGRLTLRI